MTGGPKDEGVAIILDATPWNYRPSTGGWAAGCFHNAAGVSWFRNDVTQRRSSFVLGAEGFQQPIERRWFPRQLVGLGSECGGFDRERGGLTGELHCSLSENRTRML
jgi:hypothetical protein